MNYKNKDESSFLPVVEVVEEAQKGEISKSIGLE